MKSPIDANLWTPRPVADTQTLYANWAQEYDADMARMSYATPIRIAEALAQVWSTRDAPVLDFGCGTGLSGAALRAAGFTRIDGTDICPEMLDIARSKGLYDTLRVGTPGTMPSPPGTYQAIIATGVISLGAAPPSLLRVLLNALAPGGHLAFSYNDPTLKDRSYTDALAEVLADGIARLVHRSHGPHMAEMITGSDVIVLSRQ